ncbi:sterol O-acyltransferase 2-like [Halichondria panicea]|uniref:sterol O-acyltransferase 2-like n=1 Tax=Halichondria panicea TaxID=6063 RepID=UPI00312B7D46
MAPSKRRRSKAATKVHASSSQPEANGVPPGPTTTSAEDTNVESVISASINAASGGGVRLTRSSSLDGYVSEGGDRKSEGKGKRKRIFIARDSILTALCRDDPNFRSLYHAFMVMVVTAILYSMLKDSVEAASPHIDFRMFTSGFGPPHQSLIMLLVWTPLQMAALLVYPAFKVWEWAHPRFGRVADSAAIVMMIAYNFLAHCVVVASIVHLDLPSIPSVVIALEQLRFSLKSYSFIRENGVKVLRPWSKDDEDGPHIWYGGQMEVTVGSFSKYLYFLLAPTLIYRDNYPRIPRVRPLRVLSHFIKCCISLAFVSIIVKEVFGASFTQDWQLLAKMFLSCMLWGLILQFMAGYFFLHCWSNLFGELLRFADRQFYSDWWTCNSFSQFYRKWNLLVHDWIKAYVYQDLKNKFKNPVFNKMAFVPCILMSAIYHEYVLWAPLRFVLPVLLLQYSTFGLLLFALKPSSHSSWNYLIHVGLQVGVSLMVFCYVMEFNARITCPKEENAVNTFVPRFLECYFKNLTKS